MKVVLILFALLPNGEMKKSEVITPSLNECVKLIGELSKENLRELAPGASQISLACVSVYDNVIEH